MDSQIIQMKFTDLYYQCSDMTPDELKKKVRLYDDLTGATYEAKKIAKSDDTDEIVITF